MFPWIFQKEYKLVAVVVVAYTPLWVDYCPIPFHQHSSKRNIEMHYFYGSAVVKIDIVVTIFTLALVILALQAAHD